MIQINSKDFNDKIRDRVVVQFSATWCGPCKALTKTIESNKDKFKIPCYKIDIDESMETARTYNVRAVPTLILFEAGKEIKRITGVKPLDELLQFAS